VHRDRARARELLEVVPFSEEIPSDSENSVETMSSRVTKYSSEDQNIYLPSLVPRYRFMCTRFLDMDCGRNIIGGGRCRVKTPYEWAVIVIPINGTRLLELMIDSPVLPVFKKRSP